jgi:low affinity Fe/Cu permease
MAERINIPVLVGAAPLFAVTSLVINEGYKATAIAGSSLTQLVAPTTKTITIEALLIKEFRALRPVLEAMALTSRLLASASGPLMKFTGIPVVAKTSVNLDMQITSLVFTQDNQMRDTLRVSMSLAHVPRSRLAGLIGGGLDLAVGVGSAFI